MSSKFKLLEQIHLDALNEYDKQQHRLYGQLDDLQLKCAAYEHELEATGKRHAAQVKVAHEAHTAQIKSLTQQLQEQKERCARQQTELDKVSRQMEENLSRLTTNNESSSTSAVGTSSWNMEVKSLDARITDVLTKLREREAKSSDAESLRLKCERLQAQLGDAQAKLVTLKQQQLTTAGNNGYLKFI